MPSSAENWRRYLPLALAAVLTAIAWPPAVAAGVGLPARWAVSAGEPVPAQTAGACDGVEGVTVVVDATATGGDLAVRCALGPHRNGLAALATAGFSVEGVATSPTFVCRIDGRPDAETETCAAIPPPTAYWGYWAADPGGSWEYASLGAATREPAAGSVEGWAFTSGSEQPVPPGISPGSLATAPTGIPAGPSADPGRTFPWPAVALAVAAVAVLAAAMVSARRQRAASDTDRW
ncbi:MAG: hypothetical protein H0V96_08870 [Acidimicrobiia bacterium]|nr:hypothetical protein [Acidimicrobiia bacterium]